MTTRVVHVNSDEWRKTPEDERMYIGRAVPRRGFKSSPWANHNTITPTVTREMACDFYAEKLRWDLEGGNLALDEVMALRDMVLGCWCKDAKHPNTACHGDALAWICDAPRDAVDAWLGGYHGMLELWMPLVDDNWPEVVK
jgi:Domain of unknown function (DUF4326)